MTALHAAIFDMDGLIADTEPVMRLAVNAALAPYGVQVGEEGWARMVGKRGIENFTDLKEMHGLHPEPDELLRAKNAAYHRLLRENVAPMPGVYEAIETCKAQGLKLALASSASAQDIAIVLEALRLDGAFEEVVSGDDVIKGKPDPQIFLLAAARMGVEPPRCVVLEDTAYGVTAAKAGGMRCIAVPNYFTSDQDFSRADAVLSSLVSFSPAVLQGLGAS